MNLDVALASLASGTARLVRGGTAPVIRTDQGSWCRDFLAACSVVPRDQELWLYAEGSSGHREQIGLFRADRNSELDAWTPHAANPIVRVGDSGFDAGGVFDPAVIELHGQWLLYYSATAGDAHSYALALSRSPDSPPPTDESIGVAASTDGVTFVKSPSPVIDARCPFAIRHGAGIRLFYVRAVNGGYRIYTNISEDGLHFDPGNETLALAPGAPGRWDALSVTTPKVYRGAGRYWMAYAGDDTGLDDPRGIGLAISHDLVTWERATSTPILERSTGNAFDSASVQSPLFLEVGDRVALLYAGSDRTVGDGLHSQVGLARVVPA